MGRFLIIILVVIGIISVLGFFVGYGMIKQARKDTDKRINDAEMEAAYFYNENINV